MTHPPLQLMNVTKRFAPTLPPVIQDLNLTLQEGELLTLLGPSGCGKTTALRLIAGLDTPDGGSIHIAGREVTRPFTAPERRGVGLVFQDYALFPHLNVLQNVLFGLKHLPRPERLPRARATLALVGLTVFEGRAPHQLSGGQQQRVSLARALAPRPALLLLDEPFSNLDAQLRHATRQDVRQILRHSGTAAILVTHDQEEALAFSDRVALMRNGQIEQVGPPDQVYGHPDTAFVASFLGRSNLISAAAQGNTAYTILGAVPLDTPAQGPVMLSIRPEQLSIHAEGTPAVIQSREYGGRDTHYRLKITDQEILMITNDPRPHQEGQTIHVKVNGMAKRVK